MPVNWRIRLKEIIKVAEFRESSLKPAPQTSYILKELAKAKKISNTNKLSQRAYKAEHDRIKILAEPLNK